MPADNSPMQLRRIVAVHISVRRKQARIMGKFQHFLNGLAVHIGALIAACGLSAGLAAQTVYKTVDGSGNVAYTDRPPLYQERGEKPLDVMEVEIERSDRELIAANRAAQKENERVNAVVEGIRNDQAAEDAAKAAREAEARAANCKLSRERLTKYSQARRLYRENEAGERIYLTEQEIDSERANAVRAIDQWCGN